MLETPSTPWEETAPDGSAVSAHAPVEADWEAVPGLVGHTFTHFHLELLVYRAAVDVGAGLTDAAEPERCRWVQWADLPEAALPSVMRKVLAHAFETGPRSKDLKKRASPALRRADRRSA
jgi:A/G-specific adenine glycosylase